MVNKPKALPSIIKTETSSLSKAYNISLSIDDKAMVFLKPD